VGQFLVAAEGQFKMAKDKDLPDARDEVLGTFPDLLD